MHDSIILDNSLNESETLNKSESSYFDLIHHAEYESFETKIGLDVHNASPELWQKPIGRLERLGRASAAQGLRDMQKILNDPGVCSLPSEEQWIAIRTECQRVCGMEWPVLHENTRVVPRFSVQYDTGIWSPRKLYTDVFRYYL
ncbi:hypothetical protein ACHAPK_011215 [Fusarium culmorum]